MRNFKMLKVKSEQEKKINGAISRQTTQYFIRYGILFCAESRTHGSDYFFSPKKSWSRYFILYIIIYET